MKTVAEKPIRRLLSSLLVLLSLVILLGGGYAAWRYYDAPPLDRYAPLIAQLSARQITADEQGRVDLSKSYPGLIPRDVAFVRFREDGSFLAMFPTYYGQGAELAGVLYTSRPLRESDTQQREGVIDLSERTIGVGSYGNLLLEKQINPSWYHVSYKLR